MKRALFAAAFVITALSLMAGPSLCQIGSESNQRIKARPITPRGPLTAPEKETISLFKNGTQSVVFITSLVLRQDYFSLNVFEIPQGAGSGFVWDDSGHIVTNFHVIQRAQDVEVTLYDRSTWKASVVGIAPDKDLAVLKIDTPPGRLRPIPIGTSHNLQVGQFVLAIGNPFGLDQTLTTGVISAIGREIQSVTRRPIQGVIQTDAAINPGNSGGPLLDSAGRCIGINTAIYSPSGAYAGVGFAVPIDTVNRIVPQLIAFGKVIRPGFGIQIADDYIARQLNVEGVLVMSVPRNSAGAKAGLIGTRRDRYGNFILGDVIIEVDGEKIKNANDLYKILDRKRVGERVRVKVLRDEKIMPLTIKLQAL